MRSSIEDSRARLRERMCRSIRDPRVVQAVMAVPRECFLSPEQRGHAYDNVALPIAGGQTISQPVLVARMCELLALSGGERVLDVGTGSGYHAAVLAALGARVWSIERDPALSERASRSLRDAGAAVTLSVGDGACGLPSIAPFDAVNVAAAVVDEVPAALEQQLAPGGRLIAPVRRAADERLVLVRRGRERFERFALERVRFVPLVPGPAADD